MTSWRLFTAGQAAIKTDRDDERLARSQERTRELVEKAFADLSVIAESIMTGGKTDAIRAVTERFGLTVSSLSLHLDESEQDALWAWAFNIQESAISIADFRAPESRERIDEIRNIVYTASQQLSAWYSRSAPTSSLYLMAPDGLIGKHPNPLAWTPPKRHHAAAPEGSGLRTEK